MPDGSIALAAQSEVLRLLRRHDAMVSARANFEPLWTEIGDRVSPRDSIFGKSGGIVGEKRTQRLFDSTAPLALNRFAAAMEWMLTQRTQRWHKLRAMEERLRKSAAVKRFLDDLTDLLFAVRYGPKANYASQQYEAYRSIGAFGTGMVFIDKGKGTPVRYKSLHLSETYIAENSSGVVDTVHRTFDYSARQAVQEWGSENRLPEAVTRAATEAPDKEFKFLHCVYPNSDQARERRDYRGMAYSSRYVAVEAKQIVSEGGYRTFPFAIGRYVTGPREVYGRSPAMDALPTILTLNEQEKTILRAGQRAVDPPVLLMEDGALQAFDLRSGALNFGMLNQQGQELAKPFLSGARVDIGLELMERNARLINDHFLVTLFQILVDNPQMTATEAMLRAQEKGALLAPTMGRQQSEMLGPQIEREIDLIDDAGMMPELPAELMEAGGEYEIIYESPLSRAQKAEEAAGVLQFFNAGIAMAQHRPDALDKINVDEGLDVLAEAYGVPAKVIASPEELDARRKSRSDQADTDQLINAAPVAASAAKDLVAAQQAAASGPPPVI